MSSAAQPIALDPPLRRRIVALRAAVRIEEAGSPDYRIAGGKCGLIAEAIAGEPDFGGLGIGEEYLAGAYITDDDWLISDHCWVDLPAGWLLDATADQFEEGDDIRLLAPGDPRYDRYLRWGEFSAVAATMEERADGLVARYGLDRGLARLARELADVRDHVFLTCGAGEYAALEQRLRARYPTLEVAP